jgi:hypothetical protein
MNKLLRRPRPPKLEKFILTNSISDDESSTDLLTTDESENNNTNNTNSLTNTYNGLNCQSELSSNREIVSTSLYLNGNYENKHSHSSSNEQITTIKPLAKVSLPNLNRNNLTTVASDQKNLYIIEEGRILERTNSIINNQTSIENELSVILIDHQNLEQQQKEHQQFGRLDEADQTKLLKKRSHRNISPVKTAVSQINQREQTQLIIPPLKAPGPDPLPCRPLKYHHDDLDVKKSYYETFTYEANYLDLARNQSLSKNFNNFDFNDFLIDKQSLAKQGIYRIHSSVDKSFKLTSNRNYKRMFQIIKEKISQLNDEDKKQVHKFFKNFLFSQ